MKKVITVLLAVSLLLPQLSAAAASGGGDIINLLSELEIMQGDGNGNYRLDDTVSRAEFTKVAVAASSYKNTVAKGLKISPFSDVPYTHWSAPYVKAAINGGLVEGYLDGTFHPNDTVLYEEAITIILRALGYSDGDFGASWPYGQIGKADDLKLTKNIDAGIGDALTRREVANMIYNTLNAKMKDSQSKLISVFDCEIKEDVKIISSGKGNAELAENEIFTTIGTFEYDGNFNLDYVGRRGDLYVRNGDEVAAFIPDERRSNDAAEKYVIYSKLGNEVVCYKNGVFTELDITDTTTCYKGTVQSTYGAIKSEMEMGDVLYVKTEGGSVDYVSYEKGSMEGPVKVTSASWKDSFNTKESTAVMRDGNKVSADAIQINDIIYYSGELNMVLAYTNKVTGVYESASPSKDAPSAVTISGKTYTIEGVDAFNALSSSGSARYGDTVTVLLGRNGDIAGVMGSETTAAVATAVGYVIGSGRKDFSNSDGTTYSSYYIQLVSTDGVVNEYATAIDCGSHVGEVCSVAFKDGRASVKRLVTSSVSGTVDGEAYTIGNTRFAENVKILDAVVVDWYDAVMYKNIYPQRLDGLNINSSSVLYCKKNNSGEITDMILKNVTNDAYKYGVILSRTGSKGAYTYTIDVDGSQYTYSTNQEMATKTGCRVNMYNGRVERVEIMAKYTSSITGLTDTTATINGKAYKLSDSVTVYKKTDTAMKIPLEEAKNGGYRLTAYYDRPEENGGRIRIIIAE